MSLEASAYITLNPAFHEPEILIQYSQASAFIDLLAGEQLRPRLAEDDLLVYMKQMNVRTKVAAGQSTYNELPGIDIGLSMISTPSYMFRTRVSYNHHDIAAAARWGVALPEAYRQGMRQGHYQMCRDASLYGMNPQNFEGLVNAPGATAVNLPPDSFGHTTVQTYDNGEMAFFLMQQVLAIKTRTVQLGMGKHFSIVGPMRTLGLFEYNVVQLTQAQRIGAGTMSTRELLEMVMQANGDTVSWGYDDTLQGKGANGADLVIMDMPEVSVPSATGINTNVFASTQPANPVCVTQYCDMAAPREIISPLPAGGTDVVTEWRHTSGWAPRASALTLISMPY
jgi:hypothetical protein